MEGQSPPLDFHAPKEFRKQTFSILTQPESRLAGYYHVDFFRSDVSSHHATDSLSQLANRKPVFVGERCILRIPPSSPVPSPRFSRAERIAGEPASRLYHYQHCFTSPRSPVRFDEQFTKMQKLLLSMHIC